MYLFDLLLKNDKIILHYSSSETFSEIYADL